MPGRGGGTGNGSKADPCSIVTTGSPVHAGVEDRPMGWTGFLGRAAEVPLLARLLGRGGAVYLGAGPSWSRPAFPRGGRGRSCSEAEQAVSTVELESLPI